jgi:AraC family transcriptional regulator, ethanolamine operon transcriptional activator
MKSPVPAVMTATGLNPEMLVEAIRGARLEPCVLSQRSAPSGLARFLSGNIGLDFARLGPAMQFEGEMARGAFTLVFVMECPEKGRSFNFGMEHADGYLGFFPPGGEVDAMTPKGYVNATLTVPMAEFHVALKHHLPEFPEKLLRSGAGMRVGEAEQARLRELLEEQERAMWHSPGDFEGPGVCRLMERELLAAFMAALGSGCSALIPPPTKRVGGRHRRLRQAREFLAAHGHEPVYMDDLCGAIGLTHRGVENLFQDLLGVSPMTYLRHQRLHGVRRALLQAEPGQGTVKSAALEWGFRHQGHFAREYRLLFGELPQQTLVRR